MTNCKYCNAELTHVTGRKQKSFCNVNCRNKYFYAQNKKLIQVAKSMVNNLNEQSTGTTQDLTKPPDTSNYSVNTATTRDDVLNQIKAIRDEKCPKERDKTYGRKIWEKEQQERIAELQKLLTP